MATVVSGTPAQRELVADAQRELFVDSSAGTIPAVWRDYLTLTKPRVMSLLVLTALCAMTAASAGAPSVSGLLALTVGGCFACGGASRLQPRARRDIDRMMGARTANGRWLRPHSAGGRRDLRGRHCACSRSR